MSALDLGGLSRAELERMLARLGPVATFGWHSQQEAALRAATDIIAVIGGNQSGKSKVGEGIVSRLVRREGPIYQRLKDPGGRPLTIWVCPQTFEKYSSLWERRLLDGVFRGLDYEYSRTPHPCFRWRDEHGGGELWGKAQEQGFLSFESNVVDLVLFDEEPEDVRVYNSAKTRLTTTNGVIVLTYTPLLGMSWTYHALYVPCVKPRLRVADRVWRLDHRMTVVNMGMADNPEAVAGGGVARLRADPSMSEAEKAARLYGTYGYTEGLLIKGFATLNADLDGPYLLDRLPAGVPLDWLLTADPNKRHGALLSAWDPYGNRYYVGEHYAENLPDSQHAAGYHRLLRRWKLDPLDVPVVADPGGAGAQAILNLAECGFFASPVQKDPGSVSASIKRLRRAAWVDPRHPHPTRKGADGRPALGAPRAYFLRHDPATGRGLHSEWTDGGVDYRESRLMWELRQYRQKPDAAPDTPIKCYDDVVDCARYAELTRVAEPLAPPDDVTKKERARLDEVSRREAEQFDSLAQRWEKLYQQDQQARPRD